MHYFRNLKFLLKKIADNDESYAHAAQLFAKIAQVTSKNSITWNDFLDFLIANIYPETKQRLHLTLETIQPVAHTKVHN